MRPIGESREETVDVRILSATHKNLAQLVAEGRFREDLFYRINVIEMRVPSLRERPEDVPELADTVLQRAVSPHEDGSAAPRTRKRCRSSRTTRFPATCASWKTCSSAPSRCARAG